MRKGISMIDTLRDFVEKANSIGVEYMVTGSFAMSAYGEPRMTRDIDVVLQLSEPQAELFAQVFEEQYYVSKDAIKSAIFHKSLFNIVNEQHGGRIDCIVMKDTEFARVSFSRRYEVSVSGVDFWTTTKEDLIVAKLNWAKDTHSEMQIRDIANITRTEYDSAYVDKWIEQLGLTSIWSEVTEWKTRHPLAGN